MKTIFIHRYKWSHDKRRKQLRRALKDKIVILEEEFNDGWRYSVPLDFKIKR